MKLAGGCLCGAVRYEASALCGPIAHCHCPTCRKAHGAAFSTTARVPRDGFRWVSGAEQLRWHESSPGKRRHFCSRCGSHLMAEWEGEAEVILRLGCLDGDPGARPVAHIWTELKAPWYDLDAKLPAIPRGRPRAGAPAQAAAPLAPRLLGVYLFVRDLEASLAFYRMLGLAVERVSRVFARATLGSGVLVELGTEELTRSYDPGWRQPAGPGTNTLNFELSSREAVDELYGRLVAAGYSGHLPPCDPPWQARFAIVDDPDGNVVGLHGPRDRVAERRREARGASF